MATRRTSGTRRGSASATESAREHLRRLLNPLDAVVLTRERVQEVLDDAVDRGRMTHDDASQLLGELVRRGRRQTDELLRELDGLLGAPAVRVRREMDRARATLGGGVGGIPRYDDMTAAEVAERLERLSEAELREVRAHERRNANRKTVLAAVERRLP